MSDVSASCAQMEQRCVVAILLLTTGCILFAPLLFDAGGLFFPPEVRPESTRSPESQPAQPHARKSATTREAQPKQSGGRTASQRNVTTPSFACQQGACILLVPHDVAASNTYTSAVACSVACGVEQPGLSATGAAAPFPQREAHMFHHRRRSEVSERRSASVVPIDLKAGAADPAVALSKKTSPSHRLTVDAAQQEALVLDALALGSVPVGNESLDDQLVRWLEQQHGGVCSDDTPIYFAPFSPNGIGNKLLGIVMAFHIALMQGRRLVVTDWPPSTLKTSYTLDQILHTSACQQRFDGDRKRPPVKKCSVPAARTYAHARTNTHSHACASASAYPSTPTPVTPRPRGASRNSA